MTTRYVWRNGAFRDKRTGRRMKVKDENAICAPRVQSDIPPYLSVASGKMVDGNAARREDLKATGCRPVDPSEGLPGCRTEKWAKRLNMPQVDLSEKRLTDAI